MMKSTWRNFRFRTIEQIIMSLIANHVTTGAYVSKYLFAKSLLTSVRIQTCLVFGYLVCDDIYLSSHGPHRGKDIVTPRN